MLFRSMRKIQGKFSSILAGGSDANFTSMPQVGGDPIVESGSNADGEWTKWADGLLINRYREFVINVTSNTRTSNTWTYPAPMITISNAVPSGFIINHSNSLNYTIEQPLFTNDVKLEECQFMMRATVNQEYRYAVQIIGRWK